MLPMKLSQTVTQFGVNVWSRMCDAKNIYLSKYIYIFVFTHLCHRLVDVYRLKSDKSEAQR